VLSLSVLAHHQAKAHQKPAVNMPDYRVLKEAFGPADSRDVPDGNLEIQHSRLLGFGVRLLPSHQTKWLGHACAPNLGNCSFQQSSLDFLDTTVVRGGASIIFKKPGLTLKDTMREWV